MISENKTLKYHHKNKVTIKTNKKQNKNKKQKQKQKHLQSAEYEDF